jgi:hypothetical protein
MFQITIFIKAFNFSRQIYQITLKGEKLNIELTIL